MRLAALLRHLHPPRSALELPNAVQPNGLLSRSLPLREPVRVAILGAGVGGTSLAKWLREVFRENVELTVFCDGPVGGRCRAIDFEGQRFEAGASIISELNAHFMRLMQEFGLGQRCVKDLVFLPMGVYDGKGFLISNPDPSRMLLPSLAKPISTLQLVRRYGFFGLHRLKQLAKGAGAPDFEQLYKIQAQGRAFEHPTELLDVLSPGFSGLASQTAEAWLVGEKRIPLELVRELATGGMRSNYGGQSCSDLHALVGLVSIAGGIASRCFSVVGGNEQVPRAALEAAKARVLATPAAVVRKVIGGFEVLPAANSKGELGEATGHGPRSSIGKVGSETFDIVVVAHPLERSSLRFENCPLAPTGAAMGRFRICVAHFVKGVLRPEYFGIHHDKAAPGLPLEILTTADAGTPFYSIGLQFPTSVSTAQEVQAVVDSALRGEAQVFKVFADRVLEERELSKVFRAAQGTEGPLTFQAVGWHAYPEYQVPQELHPFVLDPDGLFYLNAIEQAASALEMSLISARNAVNLITQWVDRRHKNGVD